MYTHDELDVILGPWTQKMMRAARHEGWDLFTAAGAVEIQRIDDAEELERVSPGATHLANDRQALAKVYGGTGVHHQAARLIIASHFPQEWFNMVTAHAAETEE